MLRRTFIPLNPGKVYADCASAVADVRSSTTLLVGGFGTCGVPHALCDALSRRGNEVQDMTLYTQAGALKGYGVGLLFEQRQVRRVGWSHLGNKNIAEGLFLKGELEVDFIPLGSLGERMRAGGAGIPAFYTPTSAGTVLQEGKFPRKMNPDGTVAEYMPAKETRVFRGRHHVLEEAITGDVSFIKAAKVDELGNAFFRGTSRSFNIVAAMAGKTCIVEAEEIVPVGAVKPEEVHLPGIYVQRIVQAKYPTVIEAPQWSSPSATTTEATTAAATTPPAAVAPRTREEVIARLKAMPARERIARRAALGLGSRMTVNLGIGVPMLLPQYISPSQHIRFMAETGILGMGPYPESEAAMDADYVNPGKEPITAPAGAAIFDVAEAFAMIRGSHLDLTVLGAMEVAPNGDLASWVVPGSLVKGPGGAMDLVASGCRVLVTMEHCASKKAGGASKIKRQCTLPLTSPRCVDSIITELAVFDIDKTGSDGMTLIEVAPGVSVEDVKAATEAPFKVSDNLKEMGYSWL